MEPIQPIPMDLGLNPLEVSLGEKLFKDVRLSPTNNMSCESCHYNHLGGGDALRYSTDIEGKLRTRNTLTIFNLSFQPILHWDGRFVDIYSQIEFSLTDSLKVKWPETLVYLNENVNYQALFKKAYQVDATKKLVIRALYIYQKSLITPSSRFDQYLLGKKNVITQDEEKGYQLFKQYGCISCHHGTAVGGQMFAHFGVFANYFEDRGDIIQADYGRFNITKRESDKFRFKVPSLRNIAVTGPYFHDGSVEDLGEAVEVMAKYQLGVVIPAADVEHIVLFLKTLTGRLRGKSL